MSSPSDVVHQGWLTKSPPLKGIFRPRWRRRWFVLRTGSFPNQFILQYFTDESCRRLKGRIDLEECEQLAGPLAVQDRHRFTFQIRTPNRTYYLAADSEAEMNKWITMYSKAGDENQPNNTRPHNEEVTESDESSPTLSNKIPSNIGPYIPISECFTGKPIPFNDKPDSQSVTYGNITVFEFPPKVNWATHPTKRDGENNPSSNNNNKASSAPPGVVAPPRPPKKSGFSPTSIAVTVSSPQSLSTETDNKAISTNTETEETHDSSSTCSSLHSPPGSAGVVYCNTADLFDAKNSRLLANNVGPSSSSKTNKSPSGTDTDTPPPVVDRNLKPLRKDPPKDTFRSPTVNRFSPTQKLPTPSYSSGTMTLPSRHAPNHRSPGFVAGPHIDRSRKPFDGHLTLGPTPAQMKSPVGYRVNGTLTSNRRAGPIVSPNDKRPVIYHQYEQPPDLTYLQIDCQANRDSDSSKFSMNAKISSAKKNLDMGTVEYRVIDPIKTQALIKTREERERTLRNTSISKNLN